MRRFNHCIHFTVCFIFTLIFSLSARAQLTIDKSVKAEFIALVENLPTDLQDDPGPFSKGLGLLTYSGTDTLNKNELIPSRGTVEIMDIAEDSHKYSKADQVLENSQHLPLSCSCMLSGDSLEIKTGEWPFPGFMIRLLLKGKSVKATYSERNESNVFKLNINGERVNEFITYADINNFTLDRIPSGNTSDLYGKLFISSGEFFNFEQAYNFSKGYIHQRTNLEIHFHCKIKK